MGQGEMAVVRDHQNAVETAIDMSDVEAMSTCQGFMEMLVGHRWTSAKAPEAPIIRSSP
jgi:hypothetical protein